MVGTYVYQCSIYKNACTISSSDSPLYYDTRIANSCQKCSKISEAKGIAQGLLSLMFTQ